MRTNVLACIHELTKEVADSPFNAQMIAESCNISLPESERAFASLVVEGMIRRKLKFLKYTYTLTDEGKEEIEKLFAKKG